MPPKKGRVQVWVEPAPPPERGEARCTLGKRVGALPCRCGSGRSLGRRERGWGGGVTLFTRRKLWMRVRSPRLMVPVRHVDAPPRARMRITTDDGDCLALARNPAGTDSTRGHPGASLQKSGREAGLPPPLC